MPTRPHRESIISDLDSHSTPPTNNCRVRIEGRLHGIGDTVFIPHLGYNGTILDFVGRRHLIIIPHDYGYTIRILPSKLKQGFGINCHQLIHLDELEIYYFNHLLLDTGTTTHRHRITIIGSDTYWTLPRDYD